MDRGYITKNDATPWDMIVIEVVDEEVFCLHGDVVLLFNGRERFAWDTRRRAS